MYHLKCIECGAEYSKDEVIYTCSKCDGLLDVIYDYSSIEIDMEKLKTECPSVWKYAKLLPIDREPITIQEGGTFFGGSSKNSLIHHGSNTVKQA